MITYKTPQEIAIMKKCGAILGDAMRHVVSLVKPGISTLALDTEAKKYILSQGAESSFTKVEGYKWTTCMPVNEQVVHTPPSGQVVLKQGDVLTIDMGAYLKGYHTDHAVTVVVGGDAGKVYTSFLQAGKDALDAAIQQARVGNRIGHISQAMGSIIEKAGFTVMRQLTGHGIGKELHEDPFVPGFLDKSVEKTMKLKPGMTLALEIIYSMGKSPDIAYENGNEWSIITADKSISACFEHTIALTNENTLVLT